MYCFTLNSLKIQSNTSLLLLSTLQQLHLYSTVATLNFTTTSHVFHCCVTCISQQPQSSIPCTSLALHFHFYCTSQQLHMHFTTASLIFTTTSHVLLYCFACTSQYLHGNVACILLVLHCCHIIFTTPSHALHYCQQ